MCKFNEIRVDLMGRQRRESVSGLRSMVLSSVAVFLIMLIVLASTFENKLVAEEGGKQSKSDTKLSVAQILDKAAKKQAEYKDYKGTMSQTMNMMGMNMTYKGKIYHKKPKSMRMEIETTMPGMGLATKMLIITDGEIMWTETAVGGNTMVMKTDVKAFKELLGGVMKHAGIDADSILDQSNPAGQMRAMQRMFEFNYVGDEDIKGKKMHILEGGLKDNSGGAGAQQGIAGMMRNMMQKMKLYVGVDDGFTYKSEIFDKNGATVISQKFTDVEFNTGLSDALFKYTPPKGAQIRDMVEMMKGRLAAQTKASESALKKGVTAPEFTLKDLEGKKVSLSQFKDKVIILDFWATWCPPCRKEIPHFIELYKEYKAAGLEVIGISVDDDVAPVKSFVKDKGINYTTLMADDKIQKAYGGISSIPTTFIINRNGKIVESYVGLRDKSVFESAIKPLLKQ